MRGNKTMWDNEAKDMGLIRKNDAPMGVGMGTSWGDAPAYSENRIGFRDPGQAGRQTMLPNGQPIEYKDLNLPKGLTGLLGIGGNKGETGEGENPFFIDFTKAGERPTTKYPSPLANDPSAKKLHPGQSGYMTDSPDTLDFFDTNMGKSGIGQWYKKNKGFVDPAVKGILTTLFLGPAAGLGTTARGIHNTLVKGSVPGSGSYDSRIDAFTPEGFDRYADSPWAALIPRLIGVGKGL